MSPRLLARLAAATLAAAAAAAAAARAPIVLDMDDDPDCPEPELGGRDIHGRSLAAMRFSAAAFSLEGGAAVPPRPVRPATRAMLRAPVHTCRIKLSPGLREWIKTKGALFGDELVAVQAYSQPPSLHFVDAAGQVFEHIEIADAATVADISNLLRSRGIVSEANDALSEPEPFDLRAAALAADAMEPERDMEIAMALRKAQAELAAARAEIASARAAAEAASITSAEGRVVAGERELARLQSELASMEAGASAAASIGASSGEADMLEL
jgi:hypothetical protein